MKKTKVTRRKAPAKPRDPAARWRARCAKLEARARNAEETLEAIQKGHVDALVIQGPTGDQIFTLRGADHRYRQLVETMNEGAVLLADDGTILYANARFAALAKTPLERIVGATILRFVPPSWHPLVEALLRGIGGSARAEAEMLTADDERVPVYLSTTVSQDDEHLLYVVVTDLQDQKRTKEMLATERLTAMIVEQAAEGIVVCDLTGRVIRASRAAVRVSAGNPLLGPVEEVFPIRGASGAPVARTIVEAALRGETVKGLEVSLHVDQRGPIDLLLSAAPVLGTADEALGCVLSFIDVTDRLRSAEERLRLLDRANAALAAAERANRTKDEFLAMLGHELRNPLAPILTALELLRLRGDGAARREHAVIERQVKHVVTLVDDLLDVSRITRGKIDLDRRAVEIDHVVRRALELTGPLLEDRRHHVTLDVPAGLIVDGDETRLAQVVANLVANAAKYTDPGGRIAVRAFARGDEHVIEVEDDGAGIPPELLDNLFDLFVQGQRTLDRAEGGLGLGLAIVRSLVAMHGGAVAAHSDGIGRGSRFEVALPALRDAARALAPAPIANAGLADGAQDAKRVLIVDDNVDAADLLAETLEALGHETRVAYDGPTALSAAAAFVPQIALLDIGLPVMDGYELARRMRVAVAPAPDLRLIALTGYGQESDRVRTAEAGFDKHLVKPIDMQALMAAIEGVARGS